jgi:hypothetical protein
MPSLREGDGFFAVSVLLWALARFGPLTAKTRPGVRRALRRSDEELDSLVSYAAELGFVEPADSDSEDEWRPTAAARDSEDEWRPTAAGERFGAEMLIAVEESRADGRKPYRSFYSYLPDQWTSF